MDVLKYAHRKRINLFLIGLLILLQNASIAEAQDIISTNDIWVDAQAGDDTNDGQTRGQALRTIQTAADLAVPGTKVHILPGIYRESILPAMGGIDTAPILYVAEEGPGTVILRGSETSSSLVWERMSGNSIGLPANVDPANLYAADLSSWELKSPPHFLVQLDSEGQVMTRFLPAREPDWQVKTEWKVSQFWWSATGGATPPECNPETGEDHYCDLPFRSYDQLTDTENENGLDVEPGNLTTLGDLTGATLVAMDSIHGLYVYRRQVIYHEVQTGRITVDQSCDNDEGPGLGWGSQYYLENHPALLDQPGEWWFDAGRGRLYFWPPEGINPADLNVEISRRENGFDLTNRSHTWIDGLTIEFFNGDAYAIVNEGFGEQSNDNRLSHVILRYANSGVILSQQLNDQSPPSAAIDGFTLEHSEIAHMDTVGIDSYFWWAGAPNPHTFNHSGIRNVLIRNNRIHNVGFNSEARSAVGVRAFFPDQYRFEGNHVYDIANNGVQFQLSLADAPKHFGFDRAEIKLGGILVKDNVIERACLAASDCGGLKFGGSNRPVTHVFRDVLITGNVLRNTTGWSRVSERRGVITDGDGNGLYLDYAGGFHVYRNIAYQNSGAGFKLVCLWRDGDAIFINNLAADNLLYGFKFSGDDSYCNNHNGSVNTQVVNNIIVNNGGYGIWLEDGSGDGDYGQLVIDHNLYFLNGWGVPSGWGDGADLKLMQADQPSQYFRSLDEIRANTPWEDHGQSGDPAFVNYNPMDRAPDNDLLPDFRLTAASYRALDQGTESLPVSLIDLLSTFTVDDPRYGSTLDLGPYDSDLIPIQPPPAPITPTPVPSPLFNLPSCLPGFSGFLLVFLFFPFWVKRRS